jgi:hypothetical protein
MAGHDRRLEQVADLGFFGGAVTRPMSLSNCLLDPAPATVYLGMLLAPWPVRSLIAPPQVW